MARRDCIEIDALEFETCGHVRMMTLREKGKLIEKITTAYIAGDFDFIRALPFVKKIHPHKSPYCRRHVPNSIRRDVLSSGPCVSCGTLERLTVDHIVPVARGGGDERENLQPMCFICNIRKGTR